MTIIKKIQPDGQSVKLCARNRLCILGSISYFCFVITKDIRMKFIVSSTELLKNVLTAQKAIPVKTTEAILETYLLDLEGGKLSITASDKEITLKTTLDVISAEQEGRMAVPAKQVTDLLKELPDQPLTISTVNENSFSCAWTSGESVLPCFNPDDYPVARTLAEEGKSSVTIPSDILSEGIGKTVYASSDDNNRPVMNSIFFDIKPGDTTLVASDLQKLICYNTAKVTAESECSFILNKRHANVLKSILPKENTEVQVSFDSKIVIFSLEGVTVTCSLVSGKYPDYKTIIPKNNSNILTINRLQFLNTVRRIAVCSPKASNYIKFDIAPGSIEISAQDLGFEIAAHDKIECQYEGDPLAIGFRSTHIIDILSNLDSDDVIMKFADKRRSALLLPGEESEDGSKVFAIVMPIMVR